MLRSTLSRWRRGAAKSQVIGRISAGSTVRFVFGDFEFDAEARQLRRGRDPVHLTPKAFDLLQALVDARPAAVRKEALRDRLWPDVVVSEANLKNLVAEIRAAIGDEGGRIIRTVHRFGYAFTAGERPPSTARLVGAARLHRLASGENIIGRDDDCAVLLNATGVSRRHAVIRLSGGGAVIEDLGSKNGTWRNGQRLAGPIELRDGDEIRFGAIGMTFRSSPQAESTVTED